MNIFAVLAAVLAVATGVNATVVLDQGFEQEGINFSAGVTGWTGAGSATTDGSWGSFDAGSSISTAYAHSGSQSMVVRGGNSAPAGIFTAVTADPFEVSYWLYRDTADSSVIILLQDDSPNFDLGLRVRESTGGLDTYSGSAWVDTGSSIAVGTWTRVRMDVDLSVGTFGAYDLYLTVEDGVESRVTTVTLAAAVDPVDRLVFLSQGPVENALYIDDVLLRSQGRNLISVSWGDQIMVATGDAQLDTPDKIARALKDWDQYYEAGSILWRSSSYVIREFYDLYIVPGSFTEAYYNKVVSILSVFDPLEVVRAETLENGQDLLLYMTIFDHGAPTNVLYGGTRPFPWQDRATLEHPEYQAVDRSGNYHYGVLEFAMPEARALMIDRITNYVDRFVADGIYVCTRTHSLPALHADQFGFSPPVVAEYASRYGINILEDPRFDYLSASYDRDDPALEQWRQLRGEYVVQFYRELREAMPGKIIRTGLPRGRYLGPPYGNLYLDWETLVSEKLIDGLAVGVFSNKGLHQPLYVPHASIGYLSSEDDQIAIPPFDEAVNEVYGPLSLEHGIELHTASGYSAESTNLYWSGSMLNAPGTAGFARLGADDALDAPSGQMTVEAMVCIKGIKDHISSRILSKYSHEGDNQFRGWEWMLLSDGRLSYRVNLALPGTLDTGTDLTVKSTAALPLNQWMHIATVFDRPNRTIKLYIDGALEAETSIPDLPLRATPQQPLYLGQYGGGAVQMLDGLIDELRISSVARVPTRPAVPYDGSDANTVALYHFDSATPDGTTPNDALSSVMSSAMRIFGGAAAAAPSLEPFAQALKTGGEEEAPAASLNQDFEPDGGNFAAGVMNYTGAGTATTEGRWGSFDAASTITTNYAHSGTQSMVVQRDNNSAAGIFTAVTADQFEVSYWLYRDTADSSAVILLQDGSQDLDLGLLVRTSTGRLDTYIGTGWVDTGRTIAVGVWTRVRMAVDLSVGPYGAYDLYLVVGNGAESLVSTVMLAGAADQVDRIVFLPQSPSGSTLYVDDVIVRPPPVFTVSLGSVGGGQDVINWTALGSDYIYSIYYSTNLLDGFLPLQTHLPDSVQSWTNSINASPVFYQVLFQ